MIQKVLELKIFRSLIISNQFVKILFNYMFAAAIFFYHLIRNDNIYKKMRLTLVENNKLNIINASYKNYYYYLKFILDYIFLLYKTEKKIKCYVSKIKIINLNYFKEVINSSSQPIVIFTAYMGCFYLPFFIDKIIDSVRDKSIYLLVPEADLNRRRLLLKKLTQVGYSNISLIDITSKYSGLKVARCFRDQSILICTLDISHKFTRNVKTNFLRQMTFLPTGIVSIGRNYNPRLLPFFTYYNNKNDVLEFNKPFNLKITKSKDKDINENLEKIKHIFTQKILQFPEQWIMWESLFN